MAKLRRMVFGVLIVVGVVVALAVAYRREKIAKDTTRPDTRVESVKGNRATAARINRRLNQKYRLLSQTRSNTGHNILTFRRP